MKPKPIARVAIRGTVSRASYGQYGRRWMDVRVTHEQAGPDSLEHPTITLVVLIDETQPLGFEGGQPAEGDEVEVSGHLRVLRLHCGTGLFVAAEYVGAPTRPALTSGAES